MSSLTRRADFLAANRGRRAPMPGFVLLVRPREDGDRRIRLGITVTKKIGGAVVRNRMKRRFRSLARDLLPANGIAGADHVLIGRQGGIERDFGLLRAELEKALRKVSGTSVIPAKAGTPGQESSAGLPEVPASAGMTGSEQ
ncbi:MAG TPA: ribonuclease P protein component [Allosphingosinicella sp.]